MSATNQWSIYFSQENKAKAILEFQGDYRFLSSFTSCSITYEGVSYPSVEHAYQMSKIGDKSERASMIKALSILDLPSNKVKTLSRNFNVRQDWDEIKTGVMLDLVRLKFNTNNTDNLELRRALICTSSFFKDYPLVDKTEINLEPVERINDVNNFKILIEGNSWRDKFWGVCLKSHIGQNHLGKIIMQVRNEEIIRTINFYKRYCSQDKKFIGEYPEWQTWNYTSYTGVKINFEY